MDKDIALILSEMLIKQDETNSILRDFMNVSTKQWEQQQNFNERFVSELKEIKEHIIKFSDLETRLKAIEDRENKLENRLANVERLLKAS